jgi:hypothetical protein
MNIWFCGIPGSRWSGIDICIRHCLPCDQTDETEDRIFFHKANDRGYKFNGHRGIYWGPGMTCGHSWTNLKDVGKENILDEINKEFTGEGYRVIKSHALARNNNLDFIWDNFKGDYMVLIKRDPIESFKWWDSIMSFEDDKYPSYVEMYKDRETMQKLLIEEDAYIDMFAKKHKLEWKLFDAIESFRDIQGYDYSKAITFEYNKHDDVYISVTKI